PLIKKIELIKEQNSELQQLRDWLLPLLMNGQVTIK
ncbi:restriction endonuclease subunit S, partial [Salmonella enterica]|nr:restriction endonuclease subunit S [Salmonella enterica]ECJ2473445.1 restriction endonuclease subunit S [Salmonella enterica subsp. diarizonae]